MSYIEVPPEPYYPKQMGGCIRPVRVPATTPQKGGLDGGRGASSLVRSVSTTSKTPSSIAFDAFYDLENLPYNHPLQKYHDLSKQFCEYLDLCEQKGFVIHGYDYAKGEMHNHFLEYENRWSPGRRGELSDKLDRLEYWFGLQMDRPVTMITLTSYHEGMTIQQQWDELSKSRGKLLKLLSFYFGEVVKVKNKKGKFVKKVIRSPDYFWVVEPHKKGYVHFHLAVFADVSNNKKDEYGEGIEDKFRRLWSKKYKTGNHTYGLDFSQKKGDEKLRSLKKYLSKYLQKGFLLDKWTPSLLVFNACLWDTGFRMYGASKNVSHIMNMEGEQENNIVWLETKINDVKKDTQPDGTEYTYEEERVVWYRQYIPDWLDSPFWLQDKATGYYQERKQGLIGTGIRLHPPDKTYIYDWGRPMRDISKGYDPTYGAITYL